MKKKYTVSLTNEERAYAHDVPENEGTATGFKKRASVLIIPDEGVGKPETHRQIAARCNVTEVTVWQTAKGYCESGIEKTLTFQKPENPPRPAIVTGEKEARIIAPACGDPQKDIPDGQFACWRTRGSHYT